MAFEEHVGAIVLEIDGREIDVVSVAPRVSTGRRPVRVMSRLRRIAGFTRGIPSIDLSVTAVIPKSGTPVDWENIEGAQLTIQALTGGKRTSYLDCCTVDVGEQYEVDGEARISISMFASRKVEE